MNSPHTSLAVNSVVIELPSIPPNLKNTKRIGNGKVWTDPKVKAWMESASLLILSQLKSSFRTTGASTLTASQIQSWILSSLPEDDNWNQIPDLRITGKLSPDGQPRTRITIRRIERPPC